MNNYFLAAENDIKKIFKTYIGKPLTSKIAESITQDITDYLSPKEAISLIVKKNSKGRYTVCPSNLYTLLVLKGIVLPYRLVEGKDTIQIDDRIFSFIDGKYSIKNI